MSTNGVYGFRINGKDKVTYNHNDSYPICLGEIIINVIRKNTTKIMITAAKRIQLVNMGKKPLEDQIERYREYSDTNVGEQKLDDWYCLLRNTQRRLNLYIHDIDHMIDYSKRLYGHLVGWGYCLRCS